ncbi:hypothetical protein PIB30_030150 [Stylosanthes scabra]|uniref:Uncharacterized protein n=1 Tax=Stylosanthes scabra TaxID=79078 RepID=A0ABU6QBN0_9FABA|nr:hypothetical protein [Stylosanthes scabra]
MPSPTTNPNHRTDAAASSISVEECVWWLPIYPVFDGAAPFERRLKVLHCVTGLYSSSLLLHRRLHRWAQVVGWPSIR